MKDPNTDLTFAPFDVKDDLEGMLRSPMPWALSIARPTFMFEGAEGASEEARLSDAQVSLWPKTQFVIGWQGTGGASISYRQASMAPLAAN